MSRNETCNAIVLRSYPIGEIHMGLTLFTEESGLLQAIAHGANSKRGKLRGLTNPFCYGTAFLYHDPVKKSTKVGDFDVQNFFIGLRENVRRYYTASLWAEVVLKSFGGGESARPLFALFVSSLSLLDAATEEMIPVTSVQFLARYLALVGHLPDTSECGSCGRPLTAAGSADDRPVSYSGARELFLCDRCAGSGRLQLPAAALAYLEKSLGYRSIAEAVRVPVDSAAVGALTPLLYALVGSLVETPLSTLEVGRGIL